MININECIAKAMKSKNQVELRAYKNLKAEIQFYKLLKMLNLMMKQLRYSLFLKCVRN